MKRCSRNGSGLHILYELETEELRCGKRVLECIAVGETRMDKRGGDGSCCFVVQGVTDTMEITYMEVTGTIESLEICWLKEREKSKTKPRLRADEQGRIEAGGRESEGE